MNAILEFSPDKARHRPLLLAPYYARAGRSDQRPQLHEYRDAEYMTRFAADLEKHRLQASRDQAWYRANQLDGKPWPALRQPIHKGYYLAAGELACDTKARAPVAPSRVREAWLLVMPYGEGFSDRELNPRRRRLLLQAVLSRAKAQGTAFPARPQPVLDTQGRRHTLLAGYLPVGDIAYGESDQPLQSQTQLQSGANEMAEKFAPLDYAAGDDEQLWNGTQVRPRLTALLQLLDENLGLGVAEGRLTDAAGIEGESGAPLDELADWLDAVYFYRIPDAARSGELRDAQQQFKVRRSQLLANLTLVPPVGLTQACRDAHIALRQALVDQTLPPMTPRRLGFDRIYDYTPERIAGLTKPWIDTLAALAERVETLRVELSRPANLLLGLTQPGLALTRFRNSLLACKAAAQALDAQFKPRHRYRDGSLLHWFTHLRQDQDLALQEQLPSARKLLVPGDWVAAGPALIRRRWRSLIERFSAEWQASKQAAQLGRDDEQLYQLMMLALVVGDDGCEYLAHSSPGDPFTIASHYETRMMPTYPIKMPTLKDLKKAVRGPAMVMPPDLAAEVNTLKFPDGEVKQSGDGGSMGWIYVFSIPIVTICAMILLMLMINILNFIFRWIPFAILRIPFPR